MSFYQLIFTNMDVGSINMNLLFRIDSVQSTKSSNKPSSTSSASNTFTFSPLGGVIGRSAECDWVLSDAERRLSGKHAAISFENNQYFVTDISTNGLFINESSEPLGKSKAYPVKSGDRFMMGPYTFVAMIESNKTEDVLGEPVHQASFVEHEHLINTGTDSLDDVLEFSQILDLDVTEPEIHAPEIHVSEIHSLENVESVKAVPVKPSSIKQATTHASENALYQTSESSCISFLRGAGLDESLSSHQDVNDLMFNFGQLLKSYTREMMSLMGERSSYKNRCRLDMTLVAPDHNNPLKYCVNEAQALREIVISPQPENLSGGASVESAMEDIRNHFWRVEQAYKGTLSSMLDYLSVTASTEKQPVEPSSLYSSTVKPWQYRKQIKQLNRKTKLLNDPHFYAEEFLAPRFSYFYQNPDKAQQKEMDNA